jgi:hypothetical protein
VVSGIGNVLRGLGQEIERIEDLEVARGAGEQFLVARFGEAARRIMLGLGDHLPSLRLPAEASILRSRAT